MRFEPYEYHLNELHNVFTITLCELMESGFDWGANDWGTDYPDIITDDVRERINKKFVRRFYFREICMCPPVKFKFILLDLFDEIIDKLAPLYDIINNDRFDPLEDSQKYKLWRNIYNEYPQSQLKIDECDYATTGTDYEEINKSTGDNLSKWNDFIKDYQSLDNIVLEHLEKAFLQVRSSIINVEW